MKKKLQDIIIAIKHNKGHPYLQSKILELYIVEKQIEYDKKEKKYKK